MSLFTVIFSVLILLLLFRIFKLHLRLNSDKDPAFKNLPKAVKLAILKESLLNEPTKGNLIKLTEFCRLENLTLPKEDYSPFIEEQVRISRTPDALALDNALFEKEATWLDSITPIEFEEAKEFLSENKNEFIAKTLTGILRFYSDEKIETSLQALIPDFQKAQDFLKGYQKLKQYREESLSDEESLKKLRSKRNAWERSVEDSIQYLTQLEPTPGQAKQH